MSQSRASRPKPKEGRLRRPAENEEGAPLGRCDALKPGWCAALANGHGRCPKGTCDLGPEPDPEDHAPNRDSDGVWCCDTHEQRHGDEVGW